MSSPDVLDVPDDIAIELQRQWEQLAEPGAVLRGDERVAAVAVARGERINESTQILGEAGAEVARVVGQTPAAPTQDWVDELADRGLPAERYVEIVGVVARHRAIDTFDRGVGRPRHPLPEPVDGDPTGAVANEAKKRSGWVPTVGPCGPPTALSLVPSEVELQHGLHGALYLSMEQMLDLEIVRDLRHAELELVAARTSLINDCFF